MSMVASQAGLGQPTGHQVVTLSQRLTAVNEETWLQIGKLYETMNDFDRAMMAYEAARQQNHHSIPAMQQIANILRSREQYAKAVEYFQNILNLDQNDGETWGSLGHCYLMVDDLQKAYSAYQQALYHLQNPKEPKLWYGIGILYDRYGSLEHAEEAFSQVMRMDPQFDKANEIYFRLGIIYKQQHKYAQSLECFNYIIHNPPAPLTEVEIWFQIGHVYEQQKDFVKAKETYERVLQRNPNHAKVLQQLGWLYHQQNSAADQDLAVQFLTRSLESDADDAQSWYLLGRCCMAQQKYNKAYEAYQQAVYRDGRNPSFWCSIGVLYYQINQYRDALDAYSRAIKLNPYISEVWYDLGTLYESCNDQVSDALDAYARASELDPTNPHIKARLEALKNAQSSGGRPNISGPYPQDINPSAYQSAGPGQQSWNPQQMHPVQQQQQQPQQHQQHHQGPPPLNPMAQHQQGPPSQQPQHQHQQQQIGQQQQQHAHPHRGPPTPAASQAPFRSVEAQSMRPPNSPDRSKMQNGNNGRNSMTKAELAPPSVAPYQQQAPHHVQHNPYASSHHSAGPSVASLSHGSGQTQATQGSVNSLAPMLGRTSPVSEIKSLQSRDEGHAPREEPPTPAPSRGHAGRASHPITPRATSREPDANNHLKRPREWDDHAASAPEAKKQERSDSVSRAEKTEDRPSIQDQSNRSTPARQPSARPDVVQSDMRQQRNSPPQSQQHQESRSQGPANDQSQQQEQQQQSSAPPSASVAAEQINGRAAPQDSSTSSSNSPKHVEESRQQSRQPSETKESVLPTNSTPAPSVQDKVERKVDLDENYDDE